MSFHYQYTWIEIKPEVLDMLAMNINNIYQVRNAINKFMIEEGYFKRGSCYIPDSDIYDGYMAAEKMTRCFEAGHYHYLPIMYRVLESLKLYPRGDTNFYKKIIGYDEMPMKESNGSSNSHSYSSSMISTPIKNLPSSLINIKEKEQFAELFLQSPLVRSTLDEKCIIYKSLRLLFGEDPAVYNSKRNGVISKILIELTYIYFPEMIIQSRIQRVPLEEIIKLYENMLQLATSVKLLNISKASQQDIFLKEIFQKKYISILVNKGVIPGYVYFNYLNQKVNIITTIDDAFYILHFFDWDTKLKFFSFCAETRWHPWTESLPLSLKQFTEKLYEYHLHQHEVPIILPMKDPITMDTPVERIIEEIFPGADNIKLQQQIIQSLKDQKFDTLDDLKDASGTMISACGIPLGHSAKIKAKVKEYIKKIKEC